MHAFCWLRFFNYFTSENGSAQFGFSLGADILLGLILVLTDCKDI